MRNFPRLICILLMMLLCMQSVTGLAIGVDVSCDNDLVTLNITADGNVTVKLIEYGVGEAAYNNAQKPPLDLDFINVSGSLQYKLLMPTDTAGKYTVVVTDESGSKADASFLFAILERASDILVPVKNAKSGDEIYKLINDSAASLAIDTSSEGDEDYKSYAKAACGILYGTVHDFATVAKLKDALQSAIALAAMKGKESSAVKTLLEKYEDDLGIDFDVDYVLDSSISADMKAEILYLYANADFVSELKSIIGIGGNLEYPDMCAILYDRLVALSAVRKNTGGYLNLKKIYETDYNSMLGSILSSNSSYNADNSEAVFEELANAQKYQFNKFSDLAANFNDAVKAVTNPGTTTGTIIQGNGGNVGGNGGGGGGGGSYTVSPDSVNKADDYENNLSAEGTDAIAPDEKPVSYRVPTLGGGSASYYDMPASHWASESVSILGTSGIIAGYEDGSYRPDNSITRAEFAKLVVSAFSVDATEKNDFRDVASTDWYAPYVAKTAGSGLITGYDGSFNPNGNISRQDAALILYRMASLAGVSYSGTANFSDITDIDIYAITAVRSLGNSGIIKGDENYRFNPKNNLSRAEAAKLLCALITDMSDKINEGGK